jgi:hypothetical protein
MVILSHPSILLSHLSILRDNGAASRNVPNERGGTQEP